MTDGSTEDYGVGAIEATDDELKEDAPFCETKGRTDCADDVHTSLEGRPGLTLPRATPETSSRRSKRRSKNLAW